MATIGIDCSGKIDSLPMYMVAARADDCRIIYVTRVVPAYVKRAHRDWKCIAYSCYAFKAIKPLFKKKPVTDNVLIDRDFDANALARVRKYFEHLLRDYFALPEKNLVDVGDDKDKPVLQAHTVSQLARKRKTNISLFNPNIEREFELIRGIL